MHVAWTQLQEAILVAAPQRALALLPAQAGALLSNKALATKKEQEPKYIKMIVSCPGQNTFCQSIVTRSSMQFWRNSN